MTQIPKEVRLLPLTASLRYAYKIDMGMFGSLSGFKTGMLRLMGTVVCKVLYKEKAGQQRWVKCYKHCLPNLEGNYDIAVGFLEGEASYYVIDKVNAEKKILWIHNDFNEIKKNEDVKIYENYFQKADSVVSISDKCVQILKQNYPKLTNKFYCLPNLTSGSLLKKMSEEFEVPEYEKNKFNILSIGRLTRQKGYDFAIDLALEDASEIDILGSYVQHEYYVRSYTEKAKKINLNGYYAPFLWENPWTKELKGKKVLVIHPFAETIKKQYEKREHLFENPDILPEFEKLTVIKAVQSIAGNSSETGFKDWFEALDFMKNQMDQSDYEIALIGCGAYGMSLAAHAKRQGKIAVHMAGWTQMLFGIYGNRWIEDQPEFKKYINEYWTRPGIDERPKNAEKVEGGCYW